MRFFYIGGIKKITWNQNVKWDFPNNFNQICSNDAFNSAGVTLTSVNECLYDSFEGTSNEKQIQNIKKCQEIKY